MSRPGSVKGGPRSEKSGAGRSSGRSAGGKAAPSREREGKTAEPEANEVLLRKLRENIRKAEKIAKVGHWEWNILTNEIAWSDEVFRIYGMDPAKDRPSYEVVVSTLAPEHRDRFARAVEQAVQDGVPFEGEYRVIGLDGEERFTHTIGEVVRDSDGRPVTMFGVVQDITRRRRVEESLRKAEAMYQELVETAQDLIWQCDADGRYLYLNDAWKDVLGYSVEEMLGKQFTEFMEPDTARKDLAAFDRVRREGMVKGHETVHRAKDGSARHLVFNAKLVRDDEGKVLGTRGTAYDITERKRAEEDRERLARAISIVTDGIAITDEHDRFIYLNDAHARIYGFTRSELLGRSWRDVTPQGLVPLVDKALADTLHRRDVGSWNGEAPAVRKDGMEIATEIAATARWSERGTYLGHICVVRDITDRKRAESALRESEDRFRSIFEHAMDGIMMADPEKKRNVEANRAICGMLGYTREELLGTRVENLHPKADLHRIVDLFERQVRGEISLATDIPMLRKDGSIIYVDVNATQVTLGGRTCLLGIFRDISERKRSEAALRERERQLAESQRIAHIGSWQHNLKTGTVVWSDELFRLLGLDPAQDPADFTAFFNAVHPEDQEALRAAIGSTLRDKTPFSIDYRFIRKDGATRILHAQAELVPDAAGDPVILSGTGQDITEQKEAEERIRRSEQFVRSILDTVDEGFIVVDRDYRIVSANKAYGDQVGLAPDELIGRHCYEISHRRSQPCFEDGEECSVRHVFATGTPHGVLHKHPDNDGHVLYVETKAFPIRDAAGRVASAIETINNITEKHLLEEERLKTQKLESIGTLAGGIAHDFNNLLQGVFGYISMAKLDADDRAKSIEALEEAEKALHLTVKLTNQLLTFSKGGKPLKRPMDLRPVIEHAVKFALSGSRTQSRIALDRGLSTVEADDGQIAQVVQNIVLNADQAMPLGGTIDIAARNVAAPGEGVPPGLAAGRYVEITISDRGMGIPPAYLDRIFDPYFTTKEKGSGLGLATSYSIIRNHSGTIDVRSELGKGSTFTIYLPASPAAARAADAVPAPAASGRRGRVLVMDDEEMVRKIAGRLIEALGHDVDVAKNGDEALEKYRSARDAGRTFDVVILDLTVRGGMGGAEAARKLREADRSVKTVVSSGYSDDAVTAHYREHGFHAFLKKPYNVDDLRRTLNALIV